MSSIPDRERLQEQNAQFRMAEWLLRLRTNETIRSPHFWAIGAVTALLGYIYYAVLPAFHEVYVILFFYPLLYAAIVYRLKGSLVIWAASLVMVAPNVFVTPVDAYSLIMSGLLVVFALTVGALVATQLNYLESQLASYSEIADLNDELSGYIERLETTQKELVQSEKLNALGELAASIAHEINNPLAGALVYTKLVSKKLAAGTLDKDETLANLAKIDAAVSRCSVLVKGLLDFARQSEPKLRPVLVTDIIGRTLALVGHQAQMKGVQVVRQEEAVTATVMADPDQIEQVLINLTINAIQSMSEGGTLTIRTAAGENGTVRVMVGDTGSGISPENMRRLFTPFFTTKEQGKGVGLGLAISHGIIERHGGAIEVQSEVGKGSVFTVRLPAARQSVQSA